MTEAEGDRPLRGRTVLVTGANSGIGFATTAGLARMGADVVMLCRDRRRGEDARASVRASSGSDRLELVLADLASLASIRRVAADFLETHERLDVLVNNAGVLEPRRALSADGIELTFAVNVVAPFLLTSLLLERLRSSAPSRIVNVSSGAQVTASLDLDDLQFERRRFTMMRAYGQSKLALTMLTAEQARRLAGTGVTANSLHPGAAATNIAARGGLYGFGYGIARRFMISAEEGARTSIYLASSPEVAGVSGGYFARRRPARPSRLTEDRRAAARLWRLLEEMTATG